MPSLLMMNQKAKKKLSQINKFKFKKQKIFQYGLPVLKRSYKIKNYQKNKNKFQNFKNF